MKTRNLICQCGCGTEFTQDGVGRVRRYLNDTHKSAANNARTRTLVHRGRIVKEAVLFRHIVDNMETEDIAAWYPDLSADQWCVIDAIRNSGLSYDVFSTLMLDMAVW